jgi:hypothetical protein
MIIQRGFIYLAALVPVIGELGIIEINAIEKAKKP